jgi:hypothetical protein
LSATPVDSKATHRFSTSPLNNSLDDKDEYLRAFMDHQSGFATHVAGIGHNRHHFGASV